VRTGAAGLVRRPGAGQELALSGIRSAPAAGGSDDRVIRRRFLAQCIAGLAGRVFKGDWAKAASLLSFAIASSAWALAQLGEAVRRAYPAL